MDTKLRNFQWKLTHKILLTNYYLNKMMPVEDKTILHLFYNCEAVRFFLENFFDSCSGYFHIPYFHMINAVQVLLGECTLSSLSNFLLLTIKRFIYQKKCPT